MTTTTTAAKFVNDVLPVDAISVLSNVRGRHPQPTDPDVLDLAGSIKASGLINPPTVQAINGGHVLVAGARRLAAVRALGWLTTPVRILVDESADAADTVALVENLQRRALEPMEEARAIADMLNRAPASEVAERLGFTVPFVVRTAQLTALVPDLAAAFADGRLTRGAAVALARLSPSLQAEYAADALDRLDASDPEPEHAVVGWVRSSMRSLAGVPWHRGTANWPGGLGIRGACVGCACSTATVPGLFDDVADLGDCMDAACYAGKASAHVAAALAAHPQAVALSVHFGAGRAGVARADGRQLLTLADVERTARGDLKKGRVDAVIVDGPDITRLGEVVRVRPVVREPAPGASTLASSAGAAAQVAAQAKAERAARKADKAAMAAAVDTVATAVGVQGTDLTFVLGADVLASCPVPAKRVQEAARSFGCEAVPSTAYPGADGWRACLDASSSSSARRLVAWVYLQQGAGGGVKFALSHGRVGRLAALVGVDARAAADDASKGIVAARKGKAGTGKAAKPPAARKARKGGRS
jgi:ParB/RepB/Spo0J family partition protein